MRVYFPQINLIMSNQSNHFSSTFQIRSCLIIFIVLLQGPLIIVAQSNQYESVIGLNNDIRSSSATSTVGTNNDGLAYDGDDIYDDSDDDRENMFSSSSPIPSTIITTTISYSRTKLTPNSTAHIPALTEEAHNGDYHDGDEYQNEDHHDSGTTHSDDSHSFDEQVSIHDPDPNNRKTSNLPTSRIPFVPSNLWRDLFSKPGILVGIIGGVVIGMLSAILLVMFIIYRMRKKDEGSYALEEGPRKSPSHAYTRVSSREFFA